MSQSDEAILPLSDSEVLDNTSEKSYAISEESKMDVIRSATGVPLERLNQDLVTPNVATTEIAHY